jgi:hypothetical protein
MRTQKLLPPRFKFRAFEHGYYASGEPAGIWMEKWVNGRWEYDCTQRTRAEAEEYLRDRSTDVEWWPSLARPDVLRVMDE